MLASNSVLVSALKTVCAGTSLLLMASGIPDAIVAPVKRRSTGGKSIVPFCAMLVDCVVGLWFSSLVGDGLSVRLRSLSLVLTTAYLAVMTAFSPNRFDSAQKVGATLVTLAVFFATMTLSVPRKAWIDVLGATNTATAIAFAASPLADISRILKTRDGSSIPFTMVAVLTLCATSWGLYGLLLRNVWMVVPNLCNALIGATQVALSLALPGTTAAQPPAAAAVAGKREPAGKASGVAAAGGAARRRPAAMSPPVRFAANAVTSPPGISTAGHGIAGAGGGRRAAAAAPAPVPNAVRSPPGQRSKEE